MVAGYQRVGKITRWMLGVTAIVSIITGHVIASKTKKKVIHQPVYTVDHVCKFKIAFMDHKGNDLHYTHVSPRNAIERAEDRLNQIVSHLIIYEPDDEDLLEIKKEIKHLKALDYIKMPVLLALRLSMLPSGMISKRNLSCIRGLLIDTLYYNLTCLFKSVNDEHYNLKHFKVFHRYITEALQTPERITFDE
ncbi:hypothetical protein BaOVIS_001920 [Babesia ovis]|uniref:Uncharacterized protein n=1 Tax=Babesia ovis TaxID=5869 RepID=A0A9W5T9R5_BABOV|nr:hypothetical protein BaOVIS_001920 [Babesia ovis]